VRCSPVIPSETAPSVAISKVFYTRGSLCGAEPSPFLPGPGSRHEMVPSSRKSDESVLLRIEKHFMYLKREDGSEAKLLIVSKSPLHSTQESD
jgi:hypothetical protein